MGGLADPDVQFVSSSVSRVSTSTNTVTAPSGIQNGDLLVAIAFHVGATSGLTVPAGFTIRLSDYVSQPNSLYIATKIAASESGNYSFTFSGGANANTVAILVYRNADTLAPFIGASTRATSATATAASITSPIAGAMLAIFATESTSTISTPPSGMTQRVANTASTPSLAVYDLIPNGTTATSSKTLVWSSSADAVGIQMQVFKKNSAAAKPTFIASASTQNASAGTTLVVNKPSGTQQGDLMVAVMAGGTNSGITWTGDTGWTEVADLGAKPSLRLAYKIAGSSEPSSYTFTGSNSITLSGSILTYRSAAYDTIGTFVTSTTPAPAPSISVSANYSMLIAAFANGATSTTCSTPPNMTARVTDNDATTPSYLVADELVAIGATGTRTSDIGTISNGGAGILMSIKPA